MQMLQDIKLQKQVLHSILQRLSNRISVVQRNENSVRATESLLGQHNAHVDH